MCPELNAAPPHALERRRQRGFSIVAAIFLLVTLTALGVAMLRFTTIQQQTFVQDLEGSRAYRAARTGIEWGLYQLLRTQVAGNPTCNANVTPFQAGTANALGGALSGFTVTVTCAADGPHVESGVQTNIYTLTSTATGGGVAGSPSYIERQLQVIVER